MKIHIDEIPLSGVLELKESFLPETLNLDREDIKLVEPVRVSAGVVKGNNIVTVDLNVETAVRFTCSRCLEEFQKPFSRKIRLDFPVEKSKEIDITDNLREEIILDYPLKVLCRGDCRGLCFTCGQNLNEGGCDCIEHRA